jgi:hypothetical protein
MVLGSSQKRLHCHRTSKNQWLAFIILSNPGFLQNDVNPCTRTFDLKVDAGGTTGTYQEFGCGGPSTDFWIDKNGVFYAQCTPFSEPDADGVHTTWHCS